MKINHSMTNEELLQRIEALERTIDAMRAGATIPFDIGEAFKDRLGSSITAGAASGTTYLRAVDEGGAGVYNVAKAMDGSIPFTLNGSIYNIPFYN
jgi:hypothetical protein